MADDTSNTGDQADGADEGDDADGQPQGGAGQQQAEVPPEVRKALRAANREAETLRRKLKDFEDRDKTELQKATERAAAAEKALGDAQTSALRFQVAAEKGLPAELAARLHGSDAKELAADADKLLALLNSGGGKGGAPAFNGGPRKTADGKADMNALLRNAAGYGN